MNMMEMKRNLSAFVSLVGLLVLVACGPTSNPMPTATEEMRATASPATGVDDIYVAVDGSGDYPALEQAVKAAADRATITLGPGTYRLIAGLEIAKSLTLVGAGMDETEIVSGGPDHVLSFTGSGSISAEGITFRHDGTLAADVVVVERGTGEFRDCRFTGAIYDEGTGNRAGLRFSGTSRGTAEDCDASNNDNTGILVEMQAKPDLLRNICSDNGVVGIGYMDLGRGLAKENDCTGNAIGIAVAVESRPTLEGNKCNDNEYGIAYIENGGGEAYDNECSRNRIGITVGASSTVALGDNNCQDNSEADIRDDRQSSDATS